MGLGERIFMSPAFLLFEYLRNPTQDTGILLMIRLFSVLAIIFLVFPFHESAHAFSAKWLGDDTAERQGRLTLNPFAHIDPVGAIFMLFLPFGWAKPVPVNPRNATRRVSVRGFMSITAAAGPVSNVVLALVFIILAKILGVASGSSGSSGSDFLGIFSWALWMTAWISVYIGVFNLLPVPPLDGSKILMFFLPDRAAYFLDRKAHIFRWILLGSLLILPSYANPILWFIILVSELIMAGLDIVTIFIR